MKDLTRRHFIKISGLLLSAGLLPSYAAGSTTDFDCPGCNSHNLFPDKCFNCGRGLTEGITCVSCAKKYNCLEIPFPNQKYLIDTGKPLLSMESINF